MRESGPRLAYHFLRVHTARLDVPAVFLYGGSILPGHLDHQVLDIVSVFEAVGAVGTGTLTEAELSLIESHACPTIGSCAGMFTANTMASVAEALGMSLPGSAATPAVDDRMTDYAFRSGQAVVELLRRGITARDIMTKGAGSRPIRPCISAIHSPDGLNGTRSGSGKYR